MKGSPPKSDRIKALQGNAGKRARDPIADDDDQADQLPAVAAPENSKELFFSPGWNPPTWLSDLAKEIWRQQLPIALRETKLQESGLQLFASYCDAIARQRKFSQLIELEGTTYKTDSGYVRKRPEVEMRDRAATEIRQFANELNLTPKSWINSMGTFSGRQLEMFMNGGRAAPAPTSPEAALEASKNGDQLSAFLGGKPVMQ